MYELKQVYATPHYLLVAIMNEYWAAHNRCQKNNHGDVEINVISL